MMSRRKKTGSVVPRRVDAHRADYADYADDAEYADDDDDDAIRFGTSGWRGERRICALDDRLAVGMRSWHDRA
jgi:hypothetical protein